MGISYRFFIHIFAAIGLLVWFFAAAAQTTQKSDGSESLHDLQKIDKAPMRASQETKQSIRKAVVLDPRINTRVLANGQCADVKYGSGFDYDTYRLTVVDEKYDSYFLQFVIHKYRMPPVSDDAVFMSKIALPRQYPELLCDSNRVIRSTEQLPKFFYIGLRTKHIKCPRSRLTSAVSAIYRVDSTTGALTIQNHLIGKMKFSIPNHCLPLG